MEDLWKGELKRMQTRNRLFFLDNLKVFLIMLVVAHHAGQPYGGSGGWWYFTTSNSPGLGAFFAVNAAFFMSLFFLISAYLVPTSLQRKSIGPFLRDRLARLGIPLIIGFVLLIPISWPEINFGHLWFLQHLLIYVVIYVMVQFLAQKYRKVRRDEFADKPFPHPFAIILFAILISLLTFFIRIMFPIDHWIGFLGVIQTEFAHVPQYVSFFMVGLVAAKHHWFNKIPKSIGITWLFVGIVIAFILYSGQITSFQTGGWNWGSLGYSFTETFLCTGLCIGLLFLFQLKVNVSNSTLKILSANAYSVYIFHVFIVVGLQYIVEPLPVSAYFKFFLVVVLGISLSFFISHFIIRKIPYLKKML